MVTEPVEVLQARNNSLLLRPCPSQEDGQVECGKVILYFSAIFGLVGEFMVSEFIELSNHWGLFLWLVIITAGEVEGEEPPASRGRILRETGGEA